MLTMTNVNNIRFLNKEKGLNVSEIHRKTSFDYKTIKKYLDQEDFNVHPVMKTQRKSILSPHHKQIDQWLEDDKKARRKQRHTALRIFNRLRESHSDFNVSYRTVANYVKAKRKQIYQTGCFLPLEHPGGEGQVDFGHADYIENGLKISGSYLVLSFPFSNAGYGLMFPGETAECLLEGMKQIFNHIGGIPTRLWFDNASSMVIKVKEGGDRILTDSFLRFKNHYGFSSVFCNPASGNEKGHVENKVGYIRRNMLVPIPEFKSVQEFNKLQLTRCDADMMRAHYKKDRPISELFAEEKCTFLSMPAIDYDVCRYDNALADSYGKIKLDEGKRTYSTTPSMAGCSVKVKQTALQVYILNEDLKTVVVHNRLYGKNKESMEWLPYLTQLSRKPGALKYTPIYEMLPHNLQQHLNAISKTDCGKILKTIADLTKNNSFSKAIEAVGKTLERGVIDADRIVATFNRISAPQLNLPPVKIPEGIPEFPVAKYCVDEYDALMLGGNMQ